MCNGVTPSIGLKETMDRTKKMVISYDINKILNLIHVVTISNQEISKNFGIKFDPGGAMPT